jgi:Icc-related predicted phosphoesterase
VTRFIRRNKDGTVVISIFGHVHKCQGIERVNETEKCVVKNGIK